MGPGLQAFFLARCLWLSGALTLEDAAEVYPAALALALALDLGLGVVSGGSEPTSTVTLRLRSDDLALDIMA